MPKIIKIGNRYINLDRVTEMMYDEDIKAFYFRYGPTVVGSTSQWPVSEFRDKDAEAIVSWLNRNSDHIS